MLVLGGSTPGVLSDTDLDTIYEYDVEFEVFRLQETTLVKAKKNVASVMVDSTIVECL